MSFIDLLGDDTRAAHDRMILLCAIASMGRLVADDIIVEHMARVVPAWTWEAVGHCCADLADGGALDRVRDERGHVIAWRITDDAAQWLLTATLVAVGRGAEISPPAWLRAWMRELPKVPRPTTTTSTVMKAVEP